MTCEIATVLCGPSKPNWPESDRVRFISVDNTENSLSPCECYQDILEISNADVLIYLHSDVTIHDPDWMAKIMSVFQDCTENYTKTVAVGLGGATALGNRDLYRTPYRIENMARRGYASNQTDAEVHGERFTGVRRVAVLDAFCLAVRTDWLRFRGGWPTKHLTFHCLDLFLACEAARDRKETWLVGASVTHHGGGSSTKEVYSTAQWLQGGSRESDHTEPHLWLYNEYRDVLPIETI